MNARIITQTPGRRLATALLLGAFALGARAQEGACAKPVTSAMLAEHMKLLNWKETDYVIQNEPGMKKIWDKIPPVYQAQVQADPKAFPWERVSGNRDQATMDRVEGLIREARAQSVAESLAGMPWPKLQQVLSRDKEWQAAAQKPKGSKLEAAQGSPGSFDWKGLLAQRDTCQLTAMKQNIEAAGVAAK